MNQVMPPKMDSPCREKHISPITAFCVKCQISACSHCETVLHFSHIESLAPYDLEITQMTNSLTKMKSWISKQLSIYSSYMKDQDMEKLRQQKIEEIQDSYYKFRLALKNHLLNYIRELRQTKFIDKMKSQQYAITISRIDFLKSMLKELKADLSGLMDAIYEEKYNSQISRVSRLDGIREKLEILDKAQTCEIANFNENVHELKSSEIIKTPIKDLFSVTNIDILDSSVYKISRETGTLIKYELHLGELNSLKFRNYAFPYNAAIVEIYGFVYVVGGCTSKGMPKEENCYLENIIELDPYLAKYEEKGKMFRKRMCFGCVNQGKNSIIIVGGYNNSGLISTCEKFDLLKRKSVELPQLPENKSNCSLCILDEKFLYCIGGYSTEVESTSIDLLDLSNPESKWKNIINSEIGDWHGSQNPGVIAISQTQILIFGGKCNGQIVNDSLIFDAHEKLFKKTEEMKDCDTFLGCRPILYKEKVYTFGCHENSLHEFSIKNNSWDIKTSLITRMSDQTKHSTPLVPKISDPINNNNN